MEEVTCPNCNVDVDPEELRRNHLCCPTCGYDLSEAQEPEENEEGDEEEDDEEKKAGEDDEEEENGDER